MYRTLEQALCVHSREEIKRDNFFVKWQEEHPAPEKPKQEDFMDNPPPSSHWRYDDFQKAETKYRKDMNEWSAAFNVACVEKYGRVCYTYDIDPYPDYFCEECLLLMLNFVTNNKDRPMPYTEWR